jgi:Domain of unknown function (DUF4430)
VSGGRGLATAAALACAAAAAGCGLGPGPSSRGTATLTVTRDYGSTTMVSAEEADPPASETVLRLLDREAEITTRYGGGFVQSIDGLAGREDGGRRYDWFFYVNGVESPVGAAEVHVHGGDRIWWDYRDWTDAMRVPAVVGSWPQPFARGEEKGGSRAVTIGCTGARAPCETAARRLEDAGAKARIRRSTGAKPGNRGPALLVGPWAAIRDDAAVDGLRGAPQSNGVFATFKGPIRERRHVRGRYHLIGLDVTGSPERDLGPGAGLVAALGTGDGPSTWIATGSDAVGVRRAAELLDGDDLTSRYAVAANGERAIPLPIPAHAGSGG